MHDVEGLRTPPCYVSIDSLHDSLIYGCPDVLIMLCEYCKVLDFDAASTEPGALHHKSYADLVASAENGCQLCTWIYDDGMSLSKFVEQYGHGDRLRCWYSTYTSTLFWGSGDNGPLHTITKKNVCSTEGAYCSKFAQPHSSLSDEFLLNCYP